MLLAQLHLREMWAQNGKCRMTEYLRIFGVFLWGMACGLTGVGFEYVGQRLIYSGHRFMEWGDKLWEKATFFLNEWSGSE